MRELQKTLDTLDYKCWFYETAKEAGTVEVPQQMAAENCRKVPECAHSCRNF